MRCKNSMRILLGCLLITCGVSVALAEVKLPAVIGENMVLQRGRPVPIWGWAEPGEEVTVAVSGQSLSAKAGEDGRWQVTLAKLDVGQPLEMSVKGSSGSAVTLKNLLVGEVWVCSGQSNMWWSVQSSKDKDKEIAAADFPQIRLFTVAHKSAGQPQLDCQGAWSECSPQTVPGFSAVAYFFGRHLHRELGLPIGLIHTSVGGTAAELWTSRKALEAEAALKALAGQGGSSILYNGMIAPLIPYAIRGAVWYQGESNVMRAYQYRRLFSAMIANWRADWQQGEFPFGFVQLAPFDYHKIPQWRTSPEWCAELWEAQLLTHKHVPNTGMAVTMDIGNINDIHPQNKQDVGHRLGLWALAKVYGEDLVYSGPIYQWMTIEGDRIRLKFDHTGSGLASRDGKPLSHFAIAAADEKFLPATAEIDGDTIVVHSEEVSQPVAVRFAWTDIAEPNLMNKEGLPASPFRTDRFKAATQRR